MVPLLILHRPTISFSINSRHHIIGNRDQSPWPTSKAIAKPNSIQVGRTIWTTTTTWNINSKTLGTQTQCKASSFREVQVIRYLSRRPWTPTAVIASFCLNRKGKASLTLTRFSYPSTRIGRYIRKRKRPAREMRQTRVCPIWKVLWKIKSTRKRTLIMTISKTRVEIRKKHIIYQKAP